MGEESITYNVDVLVPARIDGGSPLELHVVEHSVAVLECLVYGIPFPDIRFFWFITNNFLKLNCL